jgi:hypothetical protein
MESQVPPTINPPLLPFLFFLLTCYSAIIVVIPSNEHEKLIEIKN